MDIPSVKKVQFAEDDPMQTESLSAKSMSGADEATSSSGDDVNMTSPVASPPSSMARPTAMIPLQPGSPSAPSPRWHTHAMGPMPPPPRLQGIRHLPPIPRAPRRALDTVPILPVLTSDLPPLPEVP
ncbi:hypothetical protein PAXRUDRAFT_18020 [Paxillus rubicundulus Ve08.2h10]|uniref:Unplaced genomic scaffold scaffold_2525, whole genome shotgun sequence n=1 Tax=Paxillus rubicundulus Ve08.2h10 TaxID=930991 RepID=A0A0D0C047_9AGAM|nr:hypothetical protein PAXRUDRAFT_18020 [Paxillus rubicundulus Ve08.2h10]